MSGGLTPLAELLGLLNLSFVYIEILGGYVLLHNEDMEIEVNNLYVSGNITGVESSMVAMKQGEIAAYHILGSLDKVTETQNILLNERKQATIKFHEDIENERDSIQYLWNSRRKANND